MHHTPFDTLTRWSSSTRNGVVAALLDRWTLAVNHVLRAEPAAVERLKRHEGSVIDARALVEVLLPWAQVSGDGPAVSGAGAAASAPSTTSGPASMSWRVTAAGLLERTGEGAQARLLASSHSVTRWIRDAANDDFSWVVIEGDSAHEELKGDLRWIIDHVRWDLGGDVAKWLPQAVAAPAAQLAERVASGIKQGVKSLDAWLPGSKSGS